MIKTFTSTRTMKFSNEQKDLYEMGLKLFRHFRYENEVDSNKKEKLKTYASGDSLEIKNKKFNKALQAFAIRSANLPEDVTFNASTLALHPNVQFHTFAVIAELLDTLVPETVLDNFGQFSEIKTVGWGDQLLFTEPNTDLFVVTTQARNNRKTTRQRLMTNDLIMQPKNHAITVGEHWYRIVTGQVNFAEFINRAVLSMQNKIYTMVYDAIVDSYDTLSADYKEEGVFNARTFNQLRNRVIAKNGGGRASAFGAQTALSQIIPEQQGFQFGLGQEYNQQGYLGTFQGTNLFELAQRLIPGTDDFALDEEMVLILSSLNPRMIKIGFEGNTLTFNTPSAQSADLGQDYTMRQSFDVQLINSGAYGIYKITGE